MFHLREAYTPPILSLGRRSAFVGSMMVAVGTTTWRSYVDSNGEKWAIADHTDALIAEARDLDDLADKADESMFGGAYAEGLRKRAAEKRENKFHATLGEYPDEADPTTAYIYPYTFDGPTDPAVRAEIEKFAESAGFDKPGKGKPRIEPPEECDPLMFGAKCATTETFSSSSAQSVQYSSSDSSLIGVQSALIQLRYDLGPSGADGKPGPLTSKAIIAFKSRYGLPANDVMDDAFRGELARATAMNASAASASEGTSTTGIIIAGLVAAVVAGIYFLAS